MNVFYFNFYNIFIRKIEIKINNLGKSIKEKMFCCFTKKNPINTVDLVDLLNVSIRGTIPFIPPVEKGKVVKVYDGDTITVATRLPYSDKWYRFSVRLAGIDSAEIKGKTPNEKAAALKARDALHDLIFGKIVKLKRVSTEKYGRLLADIYLEDLHVNKWLLDNGLAIPYDGGNKAIHRPTEWD